MGESHDRAGIHKKEIKQRSVPLPISIFVEKKFAVEAGWPNVGKPQQSLSGARSAMRIANQFWCRSVGKALAPLGPRQKREVSFPKSWIDIRIIKR